MVLAWGVVNVVAVAIVCDYVVLAGLYGGDGVCYGLVLVAEVM